MPKVKTANEKLTPDLAKKQKEIMEAARKGTPLQKSCNISPEMMEFIYSEARKYYMIRKYEDAVRNFSILTALNPKDYRFSFGLAASYHQQKKWVPAVVWYLVASQVDLRSPLPYYHISDVFIQGKDTESGVNFLKKTLERMEAYPNPAYDQLKERIKRTIPPLEKLVEKERKTKG